MKRIVSMFAAALIASSAAAAPVLVDLRQAPLSPSVLTDGKKEDVAVLLLRAASREKVTADSFDALLQRQRARDAALMEIIGPDSAITHAYAKDLEKRYGAFLTDHVAKGNANAIALQMVQSIFLNRRDDLASGQALYDDAAWKKALLARVQKGEHPELHVTLNDEKKTELKNTALYVHTPGKPNGKIEPAVHIHLTALGQLIGHALLAEITQPGAPVHTQFLDAIARKLPNDTGAKAWMADWLYLREGRANAVVHDFAPDSDVMQQAVQESEAARLAR